MFEDQKKFLNTAIIEPAKNNLSSVLFWSGLFMVFIGAIFGNNIDEWALIPKGTGEAILKGGSAILGAGVFAVIMKSAQFTTLFQKHIYDVFYHPETVKEGVPLIEKWRLITSSLLKEVLPSTHLEASNKIEQQFFNTELEYHFEELNNSYEITVNQETNIITVKSYSKSTIILSPHSENPILKQGVETEGVFELLALRMNNKDVIKDGVYEQDDDNQNKTWLSIPLKDHAITRSNGVKAVRFEKIITWTQLLANDPYIKGNISRYIKGATIRYKVTNEFKVHFEKFGLGNLPKEHYLNDDGEGYERWILVTPDNLLLPGQGYILVIVPRINKVRS